MALLTNVWADQGWEVTLLTRSGPDLPDFFQLGPRVRRRHLDLFRDSTGLVDAARNNLRGLRVLRRAIRASRPDVVLSFSVETNVLAILASMGLGVPVVVEEHTDPSAHDLKRPWRILRRITYPLAASVVALSRTSLASLGRSRGRLAFVIPNPVLPPPPSAIDPSDPPTLIAIGRLSYEKGFDLLLAAFARVAAIHPEWRLDIWGRAALVRHLRNSGMRWG